MAVIIPSDARIQKFIEDFKQEPLVQKYLYNTAWTSGSQTVVHPITIDAKSIRIQWDCGKQIFDRFINRIVQKNSDIFSDGIFWKSDGSCPSTITFYFKNSSSFIPIRICDFMLLFNKRDEQRIQIYNLDTHDIEFESDYQSLTGYMLDKWRTRGVIHSIDNLEDYNTGVLVLNCTLPAEN